MSALYDHIRDTLGQAGLNLLIDTVKVALIDTGTYTVDLVNHQYYSDLSGVVGTPAALASKTLTLGVFDAADTVFPSLSGVSCEALVIYKDTGTPTTSPLIAYIDTGNGLPVTPNGQDLTLQWDAASPNIFKL